MKKMIFLFLLTLFTNAYLLAQVNIVKIKDTIILKPKPPMQIAGKNIIVPATPATTQVKQTIPSAPAANSSIYSLNSVRVNIQTGNDNKEFPSSVYLTLWTKGHIGADYNRDCLFNVADLKNELKSNSYTDFGVDKYNGGSQDKFTLESIQKTGLVMTIAYNPNFFMDAWKIEGVTITLQFKDQFGNLHPSLGNKTLRFSNATGFLNNEYHNMNCTIDQNINALNASIDK